MRIARYVMRSLPMYLTSVRRNLREMTPYSSSTNADICFTEAVYMPCIIVVQRTAVYNVQHVRPYMALNTATSLQDAWTITSYLTRYQGTRNAALYVSFMIYHQEHRVKGIPTLGNVTLQEDSHATVTCQTMLQDKRFLNF